MNTIIAIFSRHNLNDFVENFLIPGPLSLLLISSECFIKNRNPYMKS